MNRFTTPSKIDLPNHSSDITVIILAGGLKYRKKSCGPHLLFKNEGGESVLDCHMNVINKILPESDVIITTGFDSRRIINKRPKKVRIVENQLWDKTNEAEEIRLALNCCNTNNILIIQDNIIFDHHVLFQSITQYSTILTTNKEDFDDNFGVVCVNGNAENLSYGIDNYSVGMYYIREKELKPFKRICNSNNSHKMLMEIMNELINRSGIKIKMATITNGKIQKI